MIPHFQTGSIFFYGGVYVEKTKESFVGRIDGV